MIRTATLLLLLAAASTGMAGDPASAHRHQATAGPQATPELKAAVADLDQRLFDAVFNTCDADRLRPLVAEDFEFYHDKSGLSATTGTQFVNNVRAMCERQKTGEDYRARRELDAASSEVFAMSRYGALHTGVHRFYMLKPGNPEKLVEISRFANLWHQDQDGTWRLSRVLSYDHRTTE